MVKFSVIVVSDKIYRGFEKDRSGLEAIEILKNLGHEVVEYKLCPNDREHLRTAIDESVGKGVDVVLIVGGTGLGPRDISVDVVKSLEGKEVPGFGELFRSLTFEREGLKAWLTRAIAMLYSNTLIFVVPGRVEAVKLALKEIILPEVEHAISMVRGHSHWGEDWKLEG